VARVYDLLVRARGDGKDAERAIAQLQKKVQSAGRKMQSAGRALSMALTVPIAAFGALGVRELMEQEAASARTVAVLRSMGPAAATTRGHVEQLAARLERLSNVEADVIQGAINVGLSFRSLAGNEKLLDRTTAAALDMSAALGTDMQQTMIQLGKALEEPARGAAALRRSGTLTSKELDKLKRMAKDGVPVWKQQAYILKAVEKQYGGTAKAIAKTQPITRLTILVKQLAERFGTMLLPALEVVSGWVQRLASWFEGLSKSMQKKIGVALLLTAVLGPLLIALGAMVTACAALVPIIASIGVVGGAIIAVLAGWAVAAVVAWKKSDRFRVIVKKVAAVAVDLAKRVADLTTRVARFVAGVVVAIARSTTLRRVLGFLASAARMVASVVLTVVRAMGVVGGAILRTIGRSQTLRAVWQAVTAYGRLLHAVASSVAAVLVAIAKAAWEATAGLRSGLRSALVALKPAFDWVRANAGPAFDGVRRAVAAVDSAIAAVVTRVAQFISLVASAVSQVERLASKVRSLPSPSLPSIGNPFKSARGIDKTPSVAPSMRAAAGGGTTINVFPQSQDVEAIARRVAYLIGSGRVPVAAGVV